MMMQKFWISLLFMLLLSSCALAFFDHQPKAEVPVVSAYGNAQLPYALFKQGEDDYACYRIPAVVKATDGTILAFCEARKSGCSDTGDIDLVMKSSSDNGRTWSAMQVIWDDGANVCGNPAPVVDAETGAIFLLTTWNLGEDHESEIIAETSKDGRRVFVLKSTDHGNTWSEPAEITTDVKQDDWTWYATGPVHGIQLQHGPHQGRLMIPCDHIESGSKKYYSHVIYSDDHGSSWTLGGTTPLDQVNECSLAERSNGELVLNMRNYARQAGQARQVALSKDGGLTWQDQRIDPQLPEPRCQGALLAVNHKGKPYFLFTNPANDSSRVNMTLSISKDEGKTWSKKHTIFHAFSAYSDLVEMGDARILILHEGGQRSPYEAIWVSTYDWE